MADVDVIIEEFRALRRSPRPLSPEAFELCPHLTDLLGRGHTMYAAAGLGALVKLARDQVGATDRPSVDVAAWVLLQSSDRVLDRLEAAGQEFSVDQRTARRQCDKGFSVLAHFLVEVGELHEQVCDMTVALTSRAQSVLVHAIVGYPSGIHLDGFQVWKEGPEGFASSVRVDDQLPIVAERREWHGEQRTVCSTSLELTAVPGRAIVLRFAPLIPMNVMASVKITRVLPNIDAVVTHSGHVVALDLSVARIDLAQLFA